MPTRIFIDGAAGTTGLEIHERLAGREEFELIVLDEARRKDEAARRAALHEADIAILCLPDDAAREAVALAEGSKTRIIDASSAHRVAEGWTYGFPELIGHEKIANAQFVSNPGCYPTGFLALVAPLIAEGKLPADFVYTVNAVSGYSGGGNALIDRFEGDPDLAFRTYGLDLNHKHLPEMQKHAGLKRPPVFSPSVIPAHRGMIVDVPISLSATGSRWSPRAMLVMLDDWWDCSGVIRVHQIKHNPSELTLRQNEEPTDWLDVYVFGDLEALDSNDTDQIRLIARLDNLGKGASGAAIQNLNIMCGLPETTGLRL